MRLSELAGQSGVSIATIKYYLREGLLPPGRMVSRRQADYDDSHLERLRLVRALVDVGGLSLAAVQEVLDAMRLGVDDAVGVAHGALQPRPAATPPFRRAQQVVGRLGWQVDESSSAMGQLESALEAAAAVGLPVDDERLATYGAAALAVATFDIAGMPKDRAQDPEGTVTDVVLGTVLYEPLLLALRRLAQGHVYSGSLSTPPATAT